MSEFDDKASTWDTNQYRIERAREVAKGIRSAIPLHAGMTAFEYGCGTGLLSFTLQPFLGSITLADSSSGMLAVLDEKIVQAGIRNMTSLKVDLSSDPVPLLQVQLIYTLMTLHHIPDYSLVLNAFHALLEPNGYLCIADLDTEDGSFHGPEDTSVHRGFDRAALSQTLQNAGFRSVSSFTVYHTPKEVNGETKYFPIFLMTAQK